MKKTLGPTILEYREKIKLTQDQFGARYGVSGPAIFKFERGHALPSLELWMRIARDLGISDRRAVLHYVQAKLPQKYQRFIDITPAAAAEASATYADRRVDYANFEDVEAMRRAISTDTTLPRGLAALLLDDALWALYRPTGAEINFVRDAFGALGEGAMNDYRDALRLAREFLSK